MQGAPGAYNMFLGLYFQQPLALSIRYQICSCFLLVVFLQWDTITAKKLRT